MLKTPLFGVYISFFLMVTLLILVGATWMGLYLAKRITRPVQLLAAAAREIGAGHLDHRVEREAKDEFGALVEAFNSMAEELAGSRRKLERSAIDLERKTQEAEGRRRYIETILERIATGVVTIDAEGAVATVNAAAARLLGLGPEAVGQRASDLLAREDLAPLAAVLRAAMGPASAAPAQEVTLLREGRDLHLAVVASPLPGDGAAQGRVLVFDDVTPLIRSQKVAAWREVARRLAHEIKNPLTPIQLSAERLRRHFANAPAPTLAFVDECTSTIVAEVESLKGLVDEFSQFARMPAPKAVPTVLHPLLDETLALYDGLFARSADRAALCGRLAAGPRGPGADPACRHQSDRQCGGSHGTARAHHAWRRACRRPTTWCGSSSLMTALAFPSATATSCSCRTSRPSAGAAASGWPSCGASSPSTAGPSTWATTRPKAHGLRLSCRRNGLRLSAFCLRWRTQKAH